MIPNIVRPFLERFVRFHNPVTQHRINSLRLGIFMTPIHLIARVGLLLVAIVTSCSAWLHVTVQQLSAQTAPAAAAAAAPAQQPSQLRIPIINLDRRSAAITSVLPFDEPF